MILPLLEPSRWMRETAAQLLAALNPTDRFVVLNLGSSGPPGSPEDRQCDRCGVIVPDNDPLWLGNFEAAPGVIACYGLCQECLRAEVFPS